MGKLVKNSIKANVAFSYQGIDYNLHCHLDLDSMIENQTESHDLHRMIAAKNNIDTYSYLYEVMETREITYSNATGDVVSCLVENELDLQKFKDIRNKQKTDDIIQSIAMKHLNIEDINKKPDLKAALLEAYRQGKK